MGNPLKIDLNKKPLAPADAFDILMGGDKSGAQTRSMFEIFADELDDGGEDNHGDNKSKDSPSKNDRESADIVFLSPDILVPYYDHLFKPYSEEKLRVLADDISMNGIISPVYVRPFGERYQILAGHNRTEAAKLAGLTAIPCITKDCDDDTAALIFVNSNLNQREDLLPSEKAHAYKIQVEMLKKRGKKLENIESFSDDDKENQGLCQLGTENDSRRSIKPVTRSYSFQ